MKDFRTDANAREETPNPAEAFVGGLWRHLQSVLFYTLSHSSSSLRAHAGTFSGSGFRQALCIMVCCAMALTSSPDHGRKCTLGEHLLAAAARIWGRACCSPRCRTARPACAHMLAPFGVPASGKLLFVTGQQLTKAGSETCCQRGPEQDSTLSQLYSLLVSRAPAVHAHLQAPSQGLAAAAQVL